MTRLGGGVLTALLLASPSGAQSSDDPFPSPIPAADGVVTVNIVEFATLPDVDGEAARMMRLVDVPGTGRLFVNDMRGLLYGVSTDGERVERYLDLRADAWSLSVEASRGERGFQSFVFHPQSTQAGTAGYGKLYTYTYTYTDTGNTAPTPDFVPAGGDDAQDTVLLEWTPGTRGQRRAPDIAPAARVGDHVGTVARRRGSHAPSSARPDARHRRCSFSGTAGRTGRGPDHHAGRLDAATDCRGTA